MVYFNGVDAACQFYDGSLNYSSIGAVQELVKSWRVTRTASMGMGIRKRLGYKQTEAVPAFSVRYAARDTNLLENYLVKTAEGTLTKFALRYDDGQEKGEIYNIASDTVEVTTGHGRPIIVTANGIAENASKGITAVFTTEPVTAPLTFRDISTLSVFGTDLVSDFTELSFRVNNNAFGDITGNVKTPAEVFWGKADYSGRIDIAKQVTSFEGNIQSDTQGTIIVAFGGSTFTFTETDIIQAEVRLPMDLVLHRIEFQGSRLAIT